MIKMATKACGQDIPSHHDAVSNALICLASFVAQTRTRANQCGVRANMVRGVAFELSQQSSGPRVVEVSTQCDVTL